MSEKISWSFKAQVTAGPTLSESDTTEVDAYDKIEAVIPAGGSKTVDVQPGATGVKFLFISADDYEDLAYEVDGSGTDVDLDGPLILIGAGAAGLLGATQKQFEFKSSGSADVTVDILVGRDAVT